MLQNGDIIDGMYQVIREIGKGGTGVIYLGYHLRLQKQVVIKRIKDNFTGRVNVRAEADILKKLHHTYLPQVYDFLAVGSGVYTVMDYIPGHDMQYYLDLNYSFPEKTVMIWIRQLCEVLEYLHTREPQILHSDIKPANIMITPEGNVCLIDFNISLDGETGTEIQGLSQFYAAPEQYQAAMDKLYGRNSGIRLDARMDIYSLGAVFYRVMTGLCPDPRNGTPYSIMDMDIPYSDGLKNIIRRATEYSPGQRFQSARQMSRALENAARMDPEYRRLTWLQYIIGFACGLLAVAGILMIYGGAGVRQTELWHDAYSEFYQAAEAGDDTAVITQGTDMLNDLTLSGYMDDHPDAKGEVLHAVGDSYFRQEQYDQAAEYYSEALSADDDSPLYLRDYMIAMARDGRYAEAEAAAAAYPDLGLNEAENVFVEAEIACASENYEEALDRSVEALALSSDAALRAKIYGFQADVYTVVGNYAEAAEAAVSAAEEDPAADYIRRAGLMLFNAGNAERLETEKRGYYEQSLSFYEELDRRVDISYEDQMSMGLVLRALGRYEESLRHFREMKDQYPSDYEVQMWMCYDMLDEAAIEGDYAEVKEDLEFWFDSCKHLYDMQNTENTDMEELIEIMDALEERS